MIRRRTGSRDCRRRALVIADLFSRIPTLAFLAEACQEHLWQLLLILFKGMSHASIDLHVVDGYEKGSGNKSFEAEHGTSSGDCREVS